MVGAWVDSHWDHNTMLNPNDPLLFTEGGGTALVGRAPFVMPANPTAEVIAEFLCRKAAELLPADLEVVSVRVWETPNCCADFFNR